MLQSPSLIAMIAEARHHDVRQAVTATRILRSFLRPKR